MLGDALGGTWATLVQSSVAGHTAYCSAAGRLQPLGLAQGPVGLGCELGALYKACAPEHELSPLAPERFLVLFFNSL